MDMPQSDEDILVALDPLDVVEHVLTAENLQFDRTEDGDLAFTLAGDWKDYELWFAWRPEADCLQLCLSIDLNASAEQKAAAFELVCSVNQRVWLGHFEVWLGWTAVGGYLQNDENDQSGSGEDAGKGKSASARATNEVF